MVRRMGILDACQARAAPIEEVYFYTTKSRLLRRERTCEQAEASPDTAQAAEPKNPASWRCPGCR
jgi:hypothetical protein